jgi:hypothetical protein
MPEVLVKNALLSPELMLEGNSERLDKVDEALLLDHCSNGVFPPLIGVCRVRGIDGVGAGDPNRPRPAPLSRGHGRPELTAFGPGGEGGAGYRCQTGQS